MIEPVADRWGAPTYEPPYGEWPPSIPIRLLGGERVLHIALRDAATHEAQPALERALRRLGCSGYAEVDWAALGAEKAREAVRIACRELCPTIIFAQIQTGGVFDPLDVAEWRRHMPPEGVIIQWNGDLRELASHPSMAWQVALGRVMDATLVTNTNDPEWLAAQGVPGAGYLQIGYDPVIYDPNAPPAENYPFAVFLGSNYQTLGYDAPLRAELAEKLYVALDGDFGCYGFAWEGPWANPRVLQHEEAPIYRGAELAVGLSLHNDIARYTSDRTFRALGSGAVYAIKRFPDMDGLGLVDGGNCWVWDTVDDLVKLVKEYWDEREEEGFFLGRYNMRESAYRLAVEHHTWDVRMGELAAIVLDIRRRRAVG